MKPVRLLLVMVLATIGVLAATSPAWAHAKLDSSSPMQGQTLSAAPTEVKLTFAEAVTLPANPITVTGPGGVSWVVGEATLAGPVVTAPVTASGPAGQYTVTYKVISDDGDPVSGTIEFTLSAPAGAPANPAPAPTATPAPGPAGGGSPSGAWVILAVIVLAGLGLAAAKLAKARQ